MRHARVMKRGSGYQEIHEFCKGLSICSRGHAVFYDREWFHVYCFSDPADADKFLQRTRKPFRLAVGV